MLKAAIASERVDDILKKGLVNCDRKRLYQA